MTAYDQLFAIMSRTADVASAAALLGWDQETYMPDGAVAARAEQLATLSTLIHQFMTSDETIRAVERAKAEVAGDDVRRQRIVTTFERDVERSSKLPDELVHEAAHTAALAQDAWKRARMSSDFTIFLPLLEKTVELKLRQAEYLGAAEHPYDNLLDEYEPGLTVRELTPVFERLRKGTVDLLNDIEPTAHEVNDDVLHRFYAPDRQLAVATDIISNLGFSLETGRVDLSAHPFCTSFASTDVRLTTRIREHDLRSCLFGLIHEAGHGMYEQGIGADLARTSSGQGASMGIHESQSLFWENMVARSEEFWQWAFPRLRDVFPDALSDQTPREFYRSINRIVRSLNRVESDEVTYNLHIILRFEIERDLLAGALKVADIPAVWNEKMSTSLGVVPPNDAEGCLQDVHWSFGGIGYFPSYTLGKLYAAMQWKALSADMPDVRERIANGDFMPIREWLRNNIHNVGRTELPSEIVQRVCGRPLTEVDFLDYVRTKAGRVYGFA